jgi:diaminopimelate epimerase
MRAELADPSAASTYAVQLPGGALTVSVDSDGRALLKGPAVLVADGTWTG